MKLFKKKQSKKVDWSENVYIPKNNGVTKTVSQLWWEKTGHFNSELYDRVMNIKYSK